MSPIELAALAVAAVAGVTWVIYLLTRPDYRGRHARRPRWCQHCGRRTTPLTFGEFLHHLDEHEGLVR